MLRLCREAVENARAGQSCSFALKKVKGTQIRKGMLLMHPSLNPVATWQFVAEIRILFHSTTIQVNYQPVVHCGTVRQAAKITLMNSDVLRTGDKALCHFCFMYRPEFLSLGRRLLFREGRTKGVGQIVSITYDGAGPQPTEALRGAVQHAKAVHAAAGGADTPNKTSI